MLVDAAGDDADIAKILPVPNGKVSEEVKHN